MPAKDLADIILVLALFPMMVAYLFHFRALDRFSKHLQREVPGMDGARGGGSPEPSQLIQLTKDGTLLGQKLSPEALRLRSRAVTTMYIGAGLFMVMIGAMLLGTFG